MRIKQKEISWKLDECLFQNIKCYYDNNNCQLKPNAQLKLKSSLESDKPAAELVFLKLSHFSYIQVTTQLSSQVSDR